MTVAATVAASFVSCSGSPAEKKELIIKADKTIIAADGDEQVRFTVKYGDADVTADSQICITDGLCITGHTFASEEPGEYIFYATYTDGGEPIKSANTVTVIAADNFDASKNLHKNTAFFIWTATWCGPCYILKTSINRVSKEDKYIDRVLYINFYTSDDCPAGGSDDAVKFSLTEKLAEQLEQSGRFSFPGYPTSIVDFSKMESGGITADGVRGILDSYIDRPAMTGIKVNSVIENGKINAMVSVGAQEPGTYYLGVFLMEDNIVAYQNGAGDDYVHMNVTRDMGMESIFGEMLGEMKAGDVLTKSYGFDMSKSYDPENLRLFVYTLYNNEWGVRIMANAVKAPANGFKDYQYEE